MLGPGPDAEGIIITSPNPSIWYVHGDVAVELSGAIDGSIPGSFELSEYEKSLLMGLMLHVWKNLSKDFTL